MHRLVWVPGREQATEGRCWHEGAKRALLVSLNLPVDTVLLSVFLLIKPIHAQWQLKLSIAETDTSEQMDHFV